MKKALSLILLLVMLLGMMPMTASATEEAESVCDHTYENGVCTGCGAKIPNSISLRYDDHYDVSGKTVEIVDAGKPTSYQVGYGVAENAVRDTAVVTLRGDTLIATGIGSATVKIDGVLHEVTVTAAPISLLLLIGQSNMQGSEGDENQSIVCPDGMVYSTYGDRYTMTTSNATNFAPSALTGAGSALNVNGTVTNLADWPVYLLNEAGVGKKGPDSGFAYEWVKQTGEKVWVVNAAHGGSAISTWQDGGANYEECVKLFKACQETLRKEIDAGHFTLSHMGYFWCQGCTDYDKTAEWYVNKYLTMHNNLKTELAFDENTTFEFAGIIPVRAGNEGYISYRQGVYADTTSRKYYESFKDLRFTGPRVAQYWMTNNPELPDIWNVCNIGEDWVWMPDGTNGVTEYFQSHYENGTVDYPTQVKQSASWYTPTTPKAVHDSIHYNQIGYNEVGREAARNALIMLGEIVAPDVEITVELLSWDGYTPMEQVAASTAGNSGTLVVPKVYPVWKSKDVTYQLSEGLRYEYYDLLAESPLMNGALRVVGTDVAVSLVGRELTSYAWELENGTLVSTGDTENTICKVSGSTENGVFIDAQYRFEKSITLLHDQNWVLEWKMTGPWYDAESTASKKLFCEDGASSTPNAMCLLIKGNENRITIGYYNGSTTHISYGLDLDDYGISMTDTHIYRLVNHINDDGTNTIYLFVDGKQIGPMTGYFTGTSGYMGETSDWLSGRDISFSYMGAPKYLLDNGVIEYISVMECGTEFDVHFHDWSDWHTVTTPSPNGPGEETRTCSGCGQTETKIVESIWQTTNILDHWSELPEDLCSNVNLWSALEHDPTYYVNSKGDWGYHSSRDVPSVTIPVNPGDRIYATSFEAAFRNGHGSSNGIRVTWFSVNGVLKTTDPVGTYAEFTANGGYLVAPEGAVAINIPMWGDKDSYEIYILNREHTYTATVTAPTCTEQGFTTHTCTVCGESYADSYTDALGYDWILEDGCLKILFIGDSYSEDATNCGQGMQQSQLLNILQAMLGGDTEITLGLCYNGGKAMAWHATQAERETSAYSLRTIRTGGVWKGQGKCTSAEALQWTDWDIVVLQPSQAEARKGVDSNRNGDSEDEKFYPYETSIPYMLDHVAANAPQAAVCYYGLWVTDKTVALNAGLRTYEMIKAVTKDVFRYKGTNSGCRFSDAIPVGAAIQNARTSYLALLSYHPEETITLSTDPQFGLQRDVSHLSFNIGRYIAALTVAETVIPAALRVKDYTLPAIRVTESVGELPRDYTALAQAAVSSAVKNWHENGSLDVIPLKDSETDPALLAQHSLEGAKIAVTVCEADLLPKALRTTLEARLKDLRATWPELEIVQVSEPVIYGEHPLYYAEVALRFGYTEVSFRVGGRLVLCGHRETDAVTPPTCTERGYTTHICTICGESYVDGYTDPLVTVTEDAAGLALAGLPEGVTAVAAGYGGAGRMRFAAVLTGPEAALAWPGGERPARLRVFFLDAQGAPVSGRWES